MYAVYFHQFLKEVINPFATICDFYDGEFLRFMCHTHVLNVKTHVCLENMTRVN